METTEETGLWFLSDAAFAPPIGRAKPFRVGLRFIGLEEAVMAEIRSTMDIIMERAKKYSVTEEEKRDFKRRELEGKIKGFIQRYVDGLMAGERLEEEIADLREEEQEELDRLIRKEALDLVQPGRDNERLLEILSSVAGMDVGPIAGLLKDFDGRIENERAKREEVLRADLERKGISGSAVVPNLEADEEWLRAKSEAEQRFQEKLRSLS